MKKRYIVVLVLLIAGLLLSAGIVQAKGGMNGVYIKFGGEGNWVDSYWMKTGSGIAHEWRTTDGYHLVFKPTSKFSAPDCDYDSPTYVREMIAWRAHSYPEHESSEGTLSDFLDFGSTYHICWYTW